MRLIGFGETVLYKLPSKGPQHDAAGNMTSRRGQGIFLGYSRDSNANVIGTSDGIATARAVERRPLEDRWNALAVSSIQATPLSRMTKPDVETVFPQREDTLDKFPEKTIVFFSTTASCEA